MGFKPRESDAPALLYLMRGEKPNETMLFLSRSSDRRTDCPVETEKMARVGCEEAGRVPEAHRAAGLSVLLCFHQLCLSSNS